MMALAAILKNTLKIDTMDVSVNEEGVTYTFKTSGISKSLTELKAKVASVLDIPLDIPKNIEVIEAKRGRIYKDYIVKVTVPKRKIGAVRDLVAKKYPAVQARRVLYSGERDGI